MSDATATLLYPRLAREASRQIVQEHEGLTLEELLRVGSTSHPEAAPAPTGGHPVDQRVLLGLQRRIRSVAMDAGFPEPLRRGREQSFDRPCGSILYSTMAIVTADAADEGVWSFLTLVLTPEIGPWRFPERAEDRLLGRPRNVFRRVWWRAWALGTDLDWAPAGCTPLGEDEFVQIMERPTLGGNQRTARALRDALWRAESGGLSVARSELMRQLARRLRAARSHVALDALTDDQLERILDDLAVQAHLDLSGRPLTPVPLDRDESVAPVPSIRERQTADREHREDLGGLHEPSPVQTASDGPTEQVDVLVAAYSDRHQVVTKGELRELRAALGGWLKAYDVDVLVKAIRASSTLGGIEDAARRIQARLSDFGDRPAAGTRSAEKARTRAAPTDLQGDMMLVTDLFVAGDADLLARLGGKPLTPIRVAAEVQRIRGADKLPSAGAIADAFKRWEDYGFAILSSEPFAFVGYTEKGREVGLKGLLAERRADRSR